MLRDDERKANPHWVYQIYDKDETLLYVGRTSLLPMQRIRTLAQSRPELFRHDPRRFTALRFPNFYLARAWEGELIDELSPLVNAMPSGVEERREYPLVEPTRVMSGQIPLTLGAKRRKETNHV